MSALSVRAANLLPQLSSIDRSLPLGNTPTGDNPDRAHKRLRYVNEYIKEHGGLPDPTEEVKLLIAGAGIGGLTAAYQMRDLNPVILEHAPRVGGKSSGGSWEGIDFSIGAAYCVEPRINSPLERLYKELGLYNGATRTGNSPIEMGGSFFGNIWDDDVSPSTNAIKDRLRNYFNSVHLETNGIGYPHFPAVTPAQLAALKEYDKESVAGHLRRVLGEDLPPHLATMLEHYSWSTLSGSAREISAANVLSFFADEFRKVIALPAGNATVTEALLTQILDTVSPENIRCDSTVVNVKVVGDGVHVTYVTPEENLKTIFASAVVMACPKQVVRRILRDIGPELMTALEKIEYRPYMLANLLFDEENPRPDFNDLFLLGDNADGKILTEPQTLEEVGEAVQRQSKRTSVTDIIFANSANVAAGRKIGGKTVLTAYCPIAHRMGQQQLLDAFAQFESRISKELLLTDLLPRLGFKTDPVNVLYTQWGHAMPVARTGMIIDGVMEQMLKPFKGRVVFAEQGGVHPRMEAVMGLALYFEPMIRALLKNG